MKYSSLFLPAVMVLAALAVGAGSGCAKFNFSQPFAVFESEPEIPEKLVAVWTPAALHPPGKRAVRGFGGRILFHGQDPQLTMPVDGSLIVYAFDDTDADPDNPLPDKKYVFTAEEFATFESDSALGPSYSVWLPWDAVGGDQKPVTLITRFEDASGRIVMSQPAQATLPGRMPSPRERLATRRSRATGLENGDFGVRQASYQDAERERSERRSQRKMRTPLTITVAPDQAKRLLQGEATPRPAASQEMLKTYAELTARDRLPETTASPAPERSQSVSPPATRSAPAAPPARSEPTTRPSADPARRQPHRAEAPRPLPPTPRSGWSRPPATWTGDD